jgi:RNA polymerase sigma factor (sigma-70 family)
VSRDELYSTHAETIEAVIKTVCRRHRLTAERAEDLRSQIYIKLLDNDSAVLRRFQGRSSMRTYLIAVATRVLLDTRVSEWGKWRPCQAARRLGPIAIELDRLLTRDGLAYEEAVETLLTRGKVTSRGELDEIRPQLVERTSRFPVSSEVLEHVPAHGGAADRTVVAEERHTLAARAGAALARVLRELPPVEQIMLRMLYRDDMTIQRIAEVFGEKPKPLYNRLDRLRARLGQMIGDAGITAEDMRELFKGEALELPPAFADGPAGNDFCGPSRDQTPGGPHA